MGSQLQEMVPLNGSNTILGMDTVAAGQWEQLIDLTLNPDADSAATAAAPPPPDTDSLLDWGTPRPAAIRPRNTVDDGRRAYVPVASKQLVGVYLTVWARRYVDGSVVHSARPRVNYVA
jgi:hypothetical protein